MIQINYMSVSLREKKKSRKRRGYGWACVGLGCVTLKDLNVILINVSLQVGYPLFSRPNYEFSLLLSLGHNKVHWSCPYALHGHASHVGPHNKANRCAQANRVPAMWFCGGYSSSCHGYDGKQVWLIVRCSFKRFAI